MKKRLSTKISGMRYYKKHVALFLSIICLLSVYGISAYTKINQRKNTLTFTIKIFSVEKTGGGLLIHAVNKPIFRLLNVPEDFQFKVNSTYKIIVTEIKRRRYEFISAEIV